ncbi:MAG TPA: hypothetical protein VFN74_24045 [Chloroflexota bacterium]|nr:hypothetical protein [Chloroflexota bacterium]
MAARDAYVGGPFRLNRAYAERFGDAWLILSAKYGLVPPEFPIPGPYDVTFKRRGSNPVSVEDVRRQAAELRLERYERVVALGGADYRRIIQAVMESLSGQPPEMSFPTGGLGIGRAMQRLRRELAAADASERRTTS